MCSGQKYKRNGAQSPSPGAHSLPEGWPSRDCRQQRSLLGHRMRWTSEKEICPKHRETRGAGHVLRLQAEERGKREENGSGLCKARGSIHLRTQMGTERRQLYNDVIYRSDKILCNFHVSFIVQSKPDGEWKLKPVRDTFVHSFLFQCFFCKLESTESSLKKKGKKKKSYTRKETNPYLST